MSIQVIEWLRLSFAWNDCFYRTLGLDSRADGQMGSFYGIGIRPSGKEPIPVILAKGKSGVTYSYITVADGLARAIAYVGTRSAPCHSRCARPC